MNKNRKIIIFLLILLATIISLFFVIKHYNNNKNNNSSYILTLNSDISNNNIYYYNINENLKEWLFDNNFKDSFNEKVHPYIISQELINNDNSIESMFKTINSKNETNEISNFNTAFTNKFGGKNLDIENMNILNNGFISYMHSYKRYEFDNEFDKDINNKFWGINENSNNLLVQSIKVNYYIDADNYSVSIFDKDQNELIYMKNNNFDTYEKAYDFYKKNKNNLVSFLYGEDCLYIKNLNLSIFDNVKELENIVLINEENQQEIFENYYVSLDFSIDGYSSSYSKIKNELKDKDDIKYNFKENTILFIKTKNEINPYFVMSY